MTRKWFNCNIKKLYKYCLGSRIYTAYINMYIYNDTTYINMVYIYRDCISLLPRRRCSELYTFFFCIHIYVLIYYIFPLYNSTKNNITRNRIYKNFLLHYNILEKKNTTRPIFSQSKFSLTSHHTDSFYILYYIQ